MSFAQPRGSSVRHRRVCEQQEVVRKRAGDGERVGGEGNVRGRVAPALLHGVAAGAVIFSAVYFTGMFYAFSGKTEVNFGMRTATLPVRALPITRG
jgi:hypothetical protein